jgi:hypothetical protein
MWHTLPSPGLYNKQHFYTKSTFPCAHYLATLGDMSNTGYSIIKCLSSSDMTGILDQMYDNECTGGAVTDGLVSFLNISGSDKGAWTAYLHAYCISPPVRRIKLCDSSL